MNQAHFEALAAALLEVMTHAEESNGSHVDGFYEAWKMSVVAVADVCERSNINFDRDKFYEACGFND